jgi:hypothetical protein
MGQEGEVEVHDCLGVRTSTSAGFHVDSKQSFGNYVSLYFCKKEFKEKRLHKNG